jgi:hypothetical protein
MDIKRAKSGYDITSDNIDLPERMARDAVSNVFMSLCGQADKEDRFTGMQRDMSTTMVQAVRAAYAAGRQVAMQEARRAEASKLRSAEKQSVDAKKWLEDMLAAAKRQLDCMSAKVEEQNRQVYACSIAIAPISGSS